MTQLELFKGGDTSYIEQIKLMAQMVQDGRLRHKDFKVFVERLAETLKHRQLTNR